MNVRIEETPGPESVKPSIKLVIVADLGHLKAYRLEERPEFSRPRLELIQSVETAETHHLREEVTGQVGRFRKEPAVPGAQSDNEEHNLELELQHRAVKMLAEIVCELIAREHVANWYLAADARLNQSLLNQIDRSTRQKIEKNIVANLSKLDPEELVERFCRYKQAA